MRLLVSSDLGERPRGLSMPGSIYLFRLRFAREQAFSPGRPAGRLADWLTGWLASWRTSFSRIDPSHGERAFLIKLEHPPLRNYEVSLIVPVRGSRHSPFHPSHHHLRLPFLALTLFACHYTARRSPITARERDSYRCWERCSKWCRSQHRVRVYRGSLIPPGETSSSDRVADW